VLHFELMDIRPKKTSQGNSYSNKELHNAKSIQLGQGMGGVLVEPAQIREICQRFAEIAYSMGETNDVEEYAEEMSESIYDAYQRASQKRKNSK